MGESRITFHVVCFLFLSATGCGSNEAQIERPEKIVSIREVLYERETYQDLAKLWEKYYDRFPSEDAYANWMYAARYADLPGYASMVKKGLAEYPANPTLLYLVGMLEHGAHDNAEARRLLEKAIALDPMYMDPWFALVIHYMDMEEIEKQDLALRRLLEGGAISEEVMDYSYNMLVGLEQNAILITNGDNDTFPGWILTRVLNHRPDVSIVNRSLLNTDWYPLRLMKRGLPSFITKSNLETLRDGIWNEIKSGKKQISPMGPFGDTLLSRLIEAAIRAGRTVYFSETLTPTAQLEPYLSRELRLGLVTLVTPSKDSYSVHLRRVLKSWLEQFRTGGLDSWRLHHAKGALAGRQLAANYGMTLHGMMVAIREHAPDYRLALFRWYINHAQRFVPDDRADEVNNTWCRSIDIPEIRDWCRKKNYIE